MSQNFVQVLLPLALDEPFTYFAAPDIEIGDVVLVEFGRKKIWGAVFAKTKGENAKELAHTKIKTVIEKSPRLKFSSKQIKFIETISSYNLGSRGLVLRAFMGILNSDKTKKEAIAKIQEVKKEKFLLKKLSDDQQKISDQLWHLIEENKASISLLDGITGSGKTEIYFALIAKILAKNSSSQVLILLPEIALTSQLLTRFEEQFGFMPAIWHSKISKKEKREIFYGVVEGSIKVLIGARSALLLPFKNLQLIILDEEHDSSFKQVDVFNFHARDMAIVKAKLENFSVILSSATPSVETYANATLGKFHHFILGQKFGQTINEIEMVDLREEKMDSGDFLSKKLRLEIAKKMAEKKQVLLFLNRRGYAPVTLCKACGKKYECSDCDFHLVLHKSKKKLICHHCGHSEHQNDTCKFCQEKDSLIALGAGVEKVAEEVKALFPQARIALVTSDNVESFVDAQNVVEQIMKHEIDIIIGTQMIVKGYDFPELELVGIIDIDGMLYSSELRALEKTYQILTQVIGRAGRRQKAGKVIIQTYNPQNLMFEKIIKGEKKDFYNFEIKNRENAQFPPFSRFAKFEVSSFVENEAKNFAKKLIQNFPASDKIELFGPAPAPIQRLKNRHHFLVNLKVEKKVNLQKLILDVMKSLAIASTIRVRIDIDPID
jgi:primosomal protein N' (replication factor Y)